MLYVSSYNQLIYKSLQQSRNHSYRAETLHIACFRPLLLCSKFVRTMFPAHYYFTAKYETTRLPDYSDLFGFSLLAVVLALMCHSDNGSIAFD